MGDKDSEINDVMKVCRLCLRTDDLIWIFDDRIGETQNMQDLVQITTGVTITRDDNVSQMLCHRCRQITIGIFKFRSSSLVNNMELKAKVAKKINLHKSVKSLLDEYPKIILPSSISKCNISPRVIIDKNTISSWMGVYKKRRKMEKKMKKQLKLATEKILLTEKDHIEINVENDNNSSLLTSNKEPVSSNEVPKLPTLQPKITSFVSQIPKRLEQNLHLPDKENPIGSINHKDENNSPISIQSKTNHVQSVGKRKSSVDIDSKKEKKSKLETDYESNDSLVTLKYVTKSLFICDICNSILYSAKDLKKHKLKHMRCHLCKQNFRTLQETKDHCENNCTIKNIMNNLPTVYLKRCDEIKDLVDRYLSAKIPDSELENKIEISVPLETAEDQCEDPLAIDNNEIKAALLSQLEIGPQPFSEILLISDDEDDVSSRKKQYTLPTNIVTTKSNVTNKSENSVLLNKIVKQSSTKTDIKPSNAEKPKNKPVNKELSKTTITPSIEIIGENIIDLNWDNSDASLLKNIIRRTKKTKNDVSVQTEMPSSNDILPLSTKDKLFELKNLRKFLNFYKIPVNISYAGQPAVKYGFDSLPFTKKDRSWSKINTKVIPGKSLVIDKVTQKDTHVSIAASSKASRVPSTDLPPTNTNTSLQTSVPNSVIPTVIASMESVTHTSRVENATTSQPNVIHTINAATIPPIFNTYYRPIISNTVQNSSLLHYLNLPKNQQQGSQSIASSQQKFIILNNSFPNNTSPGTSICNNVSVSSLSSITISDIQKSTSFLDNQPLQLGDSNLPLPVAKSIPLSSNTYAATQSKATSTVTNNLHKSNTIQAPKTFDNLSNISRSTPVVNVSMSSPIVINNMLSAVTNCGMPPPTKSYVRQTSSTSSIKPAMNYTTISTPCIKPAMNYTTISTSSIKPAMNYTTISTPSIKPAMNNTKTQRPIQSRFENSAITEPAPSISSWNGGSNFKPTIRVKNVSELR
ncbi:hypothetical protein HHI36_002900 [Cryptolaemus montrouzieri]|uniref:ZAD domain-containing protein n=1 Tax=Cryptolaemus montrouzieri TaxID=559131 RepID=A0ABD2PDC9_9CUCU